MSITYQFSTNCHVASQADSEEINTYIKKQSDTIVVIRFVFAATHLTKFKIHFLINIGLFWYASGVVFGSAHLK